MSALIVKPDMGKGWESGDKSPHSREVVSPSLRAFVPGEPRAYEMKFLVGEPEARMIESLVRPRLALDPHGDPALGNAYRTTTLYCDTPAGDVLRGIGLHRRRKYRLRRYGSDARIFLERKSKRGERVRKRRSAIDAEGLLQLDEPGTEAGWPGRWFREQTRARGLGPVLRAHYLRTAYFGATSEGPVRVTFDRNVRGLVTSEWCVAPFSEGAPVLAGQVVCEFKFRGVLPASLRSIIQMLQLLPCGVSKYRRCAEAAGLTPAAAPPARSAEEGGPSRA